MEKAKVTTISQSSVTVLDRIKIALTQMAIFRRAEMDKPTLSLFSKRLEQERPEDVFAALHKLEELPRQEGEPALPELGTLLAMVRAEGINRQHRTNAANDLELIGWQCETCRRSVTGFFPRAANKATEPRYCQAPPQRQGSRSGEICGGEMRVVHREAHQDDREQVA